MLRAVVTVFVVVVYLYDRGVALLMLARCAQRFEYDVIDVVADLCDLGTPWWIGALPRWRRRHGGAAHRFEIEALFNCRYRVPLPAG